MSNSFQPVVDYFKMDVEGSEYDAVEAMSEDGVLEKIKQIGLEVLFHVIYCRKYL